MGVKNLWRLLLPTSRRISIQSLSHQTLAIDASIWLTQISKACRDPETGRLLPNRPHVRIFLLRLMRLLFHEIRPVVVFDGIMPEVKRREIERRRDRREKLWRDDEEECGGGGALKRTAKKILVQRLKELKRIEKVGDLKDEIVGERKEKVSVCGAFAAGFVPAEAPVSEERESVTDHSSKIQIDASDEAKINADNTKVEDEIISIHSDQQIQRNNSYDSENDWETSHAVQSSITASLSQKPIPITTTIDTTTPNETIASLPTLSRTQWIDSQFRAQRIQSRQECIAVAGDMAEYSSTQLRNFLRGSRLNQKMNEIGVLAGKTERSENDLSEEKAEEVSMKVLFGEDANDESETNEPEEDDESGGGFLLPSDQSSSKAKSCQDVASKEAVIVLRDSNKEYNFEEKKLSGSDALESTSTSKQIQHTQNSVNVTSVENQQSKLAALATAEDEWAAWGKEDTDSDNEAQSNHRTNADTSQANNSHLQNDYGSSDDERDETFLTLAAGSKKPLANEGTPSVQDMMEPETKAQFDASDTAPVDSDADMESVDWEDGNSDDEVSDTDNKASLSTTNALLEFNSNSENKIISSKSDTNLAPEYSNNGTTDAKSGEQREIIEVKSDDDVCWEDGSTDANKNPPENSNEVIGSCSIDDNASGEVQADHESPTNAPTAHKHLALHDEGLNETDSVEEVYTNEFDMPQPENPNIVALQHAQETASKLTNWAGRAVQRAIASHLEQHKSRVPKEPTSTKENEVDLTHTENEVDSKVPAPDNNKLPDNRKNQRKVEFLDTSIEGLNAAHQAILEEEKLMERDMSTITDEMKEDILKLLQLCGIPWIESPSEAEAQCAALEELGLVDGIVTEDSDVFVFGGRKVYKNFFNEQQYVEAYYARDAEKELGLGKNQLISLAMLLGSDYTDGVKGVGIVNGMEILQAFPVDNIREGLQEFRDWLDGFGDDPNLLNKDADKESTYLTKRAIFHKKHKSARTRWVAPADFPSQAIINAYIKPAVDKSDGKFTWSKPQIDELQQFCAETLGWDQEETDRVVLPVLKVLENKSKQRRLESYFMKYDDGIKFAEVRSKRLKSVIEGVQGKQKKAKRNQDDILDEDSPKQPAKKIKL